MSFSLQKMDLPIYHGSRAIFESFDSSFIGTGENAGIGYGFYFATSLKGAANHCWSYCRGDGEKVIYVCKFTKSAKILFVGESVSNHSLDVVNTWGKLPHQYQKMISSKSWFGETTALQSQQINTDEKIKMLCQILHKVGFDAIYDIEGSSTDSYFHGKSILVLEPESVDIVERLSAVEILDETCGAPKEYYLSEKKQFLDKKNVLSFLRRL
jgi:hypothetical protein